MCVEHNKMNKLDKFAKFDERDLEQFERKLRMAMARREAPLGLKSRVLAQARERRQAQHGRLWIWQRVAATLVVAAVLGGFAEYRHIEEQRALEQRKGEAAREQVLTALRITGKTMNRVQEKLADER
jgi:hypothetical protein